MPSENPAPEKCLHCGGPPTANGFSHGQHQTACDCRAYLKTVTTDLYEAMEKEAVLLRETAVHIERWSRHRMISADTSDAMEAVAGKLRAQEQEIRAALLKANPKRKTDAG